MSIDAIKIFCSICFSTDHWANDEINFRVDFFFSSWINNLHCTHGCVHNRWNILSCYEAIAFCFSIESSITACSTAHSENSSVRLSHVKIYFQKLVSNGSTAGKPQSILKQYPRFTFVIITEHCKAVIDIYHMCTDSSVIIFECALAHRSAYNWFNKCCVCRSQFKN